MDRRQFLLAAASLAAAPRRLAGGADPVALATAELESHVVVFDLASQRVLRRIPTPADPRSIETVGRLAVAAHWNAGAVSVLDAVRVRHVVRGFAAPRYTVAHPDGRHAYVTDAARGQLVTLDVPRGRIVSRTAVGVDARHAAIDAGAAAVWVALGQKATELAVVDVSRPDRPRLVDRVRPPFLAHDVGFAPDAKHVWVSSGNRNEIAIYSPLGRLLRTISADWPPQHVTFADGRVYVTSGWSGTLNAHAYGGAHLSRTVVPVGSYNVQSGAGRVITPSLGRGLLTVCDAGAVVSEQRVARSSHDACVL